jgi:salicylate hydroxylase
MIGMVNLERRWPIGDRYPQRGWSDGRVVMLGDAAHATLQSLAQGACMAIEDAVILAALIDVCDGAFDAAFREFERRRLLRTARVQLESRYMWNIFYHTEGVEAEVRNEIQRARTNEDIFRCVDWLYDAQEVPDRLAG